MTGSANTVLELKNVRFSYRQRHSLFHAVEYAALKDISFSVERGETVGVIGRNGCGKSTLLRVIAGIYRPSGGNIVRNCRKISLLSLALGFDPNLTGRENAVISGILLGATRRDVEAELDEILEFSELGPFIDEPIKTYSSGMKARLGFSVALKLRAELLLIDETLSVGDIHFRKKAEEAMMAKIDSDQTVLLVSHSLSQAARLCNRMVWIDKGRVRECGPPDSVIARYEAEVDNP